MTTSPNIEPVHFTRMTDKNAPLDISRPFNRSVSLITYGYNEELLTLDFLERSVALMDSCCEDYEIVFVDDGSRDKTNEIVSAFAKTHSQVRLFTNEVNRNIGPSFKRAVAESTKDYILWQMVDWCYDLDNLRIYLELLKRYDVVVGIRPTPARILSHIPVIKSIYRVKSRSDDMFRALVSLGNYYVLRILFGLRFYDIQNVHIYPRTLLHQEPLKGNSSFLSGECLTRAWENDCSFIEVPIRFLPREAGEAKGVTIKTIWRSATDILWNWIKWGWKFRLGMNTSKSYIHQVQNPIFLNEEIVHLTAPLFKYFR